MPQHLLHHMQIRPVLHQMGREGMTQGMGRNLRLDARLLHVLLQKLPEALAAHALPGTVGKQHLAFLIPHQLLPGALHIALQGLPGLVPVGHDALPVPIPADDVIQLPVHILQAQGNQLRHTDSRGIEKLQHGPVPKPLGRAVAGLLQKPGHLLHGKDIRNLLLYLRRLQVLRRILGNIPFLPQVQIKALHGGDIARYRGRGHSLLFQIQYIRIQIRLRHVLRPIDLLIVQEPHHFYQISAVGKLRILRRLLYVMQISYKALNLLFHKTPLSLDSKPPKSAV